MGAQEHSCNSTFCPPVHASSLPVDTSDDTLNVENRLVFLVLFTECNLKCTHCLNKSYFHRQHKKRDLSYWKKTADRLLKSGYTNLSILGGEPLLSDLTLHFAEHLGATGWSNVTIHTNLFSINKIFINMLKKFNFTVATSIYSDTPKSHDSYTGKPGSYREKINNIKLLSKNGIRINIGFIEKREDKDHETFFQSFKAKKNITFYQSKLLNITPEDNLQQECESIYDCSSCKNIDVITTNGTSGCIFDSFKQAHPAAAFSAKHD